jgi:glucokinase
MAGNQLARDEYVVATRVLGWAIAQVITVVAPEVVVVGGGVSLVGEEVFFAPLRNAVRQYAFPPLSNSYKLLPAALGESVVVHGALALARLSH